MIRASTSFAVVACTVSVALHLSGIAVMWREDSPQFQGAAPSAVTRLGNSFRDVVDGVQNPVETEETREAEQVTDLTTPIDQDAPLEQVTPENVLEPTPPQTVKTKPTQPSPSETPQQVTQAAAIAPVSPAQETAQGAPPAMTAPVVAKNAVASLATLQTSNAIALEPAQPLTSLEVVQPAPVQTQPALLDPAETPDATISDPVQPQVLKAAPSDESETAVQVSKRPKLRSRTVETAQAQPVKPKPKQRATPKSQPEQGEQKPRQNAGRLDGQESGTHAQTSTSNRRATQVGNATVSNYPGKVVRKIERARRPRVRGVRGVTYLAFSIAPNGALASLRVSRSSGNAQLDAAALQIIRAAAPFPKPPRGAKTAFGYQIEY